VPDALPVESQNCTEVEEISTGKGSQHGKVECGGQASEAAAADLRAPSEVAPEIVWQVGMFSFSSSKFEKS
jgi:hypothetical protein